VPAQGLASALSMVLSMVLSTALFLGVCVITLDSGGAGMFQSARPWTRHA
jgi:hypothetical protein